MRKYRTIVADPPWDHEDGTGLDFSNGRHVTGLVYPTMSVEEIAALPVRDLSQTDPVSGTSKKRMRQIGKEPQAGLGSHLYLWTTNRFLCDAHEVMRAWGFKPSAILVWCKARRGFNVGGTWPSNVEFIVFGRRGSPPATGRADSRWFEWPRGKHSAKPEAFYDLVETLSPGPYLELFARRQRLGWDTWGDEALNHVEIAS